MLQLRKCTRKMESYVEEYCYTGLVLQKQSWRDIFMAARKMTLEQSFEGIDNIINELQSGELTLEESFKKYEEGMKLIKNCNDAIDKVEKKLIVIENKQVEEV